jgi:hypothetical protein
LETLSSVNIHKGDEGDIKEGTDWYFLELITKEQRVFLRPEGSTKAKMEEWKDLLEDNEFFFKRIELQLKDDTTRPFNNCVSKHASHTAIANQIMSAEVQSSEEDVLASTHGPDSSLAGANQFSNG